MASSKKIVINNLTIVWQGQSWCVIMPDGKVKARFPDKDDAISYAEQNGYAARKIDLNDISRASRPEEQTTAEFTALKQPPKPKNDDLYVREPSLWDSLQRFDVQAIVLTLVGLGTIVLGIIALPSLISVVEGIPSGVGNILSSPLVPIAVVVIIAIAAVAFIGGNSGIGENPEGCLTILFLVAAIAICYALGILPAIWNLVF